MWLIDQLVEQHIKAAQEKGELSNLLAKASRFSLKMTAMCRKRYAADTVC
nr:detoxification of methylglyoxal, YhdN [Candidatus Pantoea persica]